MAIIKSKDAIKMNATEIKEKIKELRIELIKARAINKKGGKTSLREIKRTIARLLTIKPKLETKQESKSNKMEKKA